MCPWHSLWSQSPFYLSQFNQFITFITVLTNSNSLSNQPLIMAPHSTKTSLRGHMEHESPIPDPQEPSTSAHIEEVLEEDMPDNQTDNQTDNQMDSSAPNLAEAIVLMTNELRWWASSSSATVKPMILRFSTVLPRALARAYLSDLHHWILLGYPITTHFKLYLSSQNCQSYAIYSLSCLTFITIKLSYKLSAITSAANTIKWSNSML